MNSASSGGVRRRTSTHSSVGDALESQPPIISSRRKGANNTDPLNDVVLKEEPYNNLKSKRRSPRAAFIANMLKYRVVKLILVLLCALVFVLSFSATWSRLHTKDPCDVARDAVAQFGASETRTQENGEPLEFPKIVHQQWKTATVPEGNQRLWHEKWKAHFPEPEYTHMMWTDESARELIRDDFPWFLTVYDGYKFAIQRADAVRYFILYKYGGIYADLDYEPLTNFWEYIPKDRVGLVESPYQYNEYVQNSLMTSPKEDPFWQRTFKVLIEMSSSPVLKATGPMFLDYAVKSNSHPFYSLPCENFQRLPFGESHNSPGLSILHREILGRLFPMKHCGNYVDPKCQFAKHHNTATYLGDTGVLNLIWT